MDTSIHFSSASGNWYTIKESGGYCERFYKRRLKKVSI